MYMYSWNVLVFAKNYGNCSVLRTMQNVKMSYKCFLECVNKSHGPIPLPHRTPVVIGRSPETLIQNTKVSRNQVEITADCIKRTANVKQLGNNHGYIDKTELEKGNSETLKKNQLLYLISGLYPHTITFKLQNKEHGKEDSPKKSIKDFFTEDGSKSEAKKRPRSEMEADHVIVKRPRQDLSDSDDEEEVRQIAERLKVMRENVKSSDSKPSTSKSHQGASVNGGAANKGTTGVGQKGEPRDMAEWTEKDTLMVHRSKNLCASSRIAAFDIDSTIICTQSGKVFPTHEGDWKIMLPEIPGGLKKLHAEGYKIVFITNQMGIQRGKVKIPEYKQKIENIISKLGVPVHVLVSKGAGPYRKPGLGMWKHLVNYDNDGIKVDISQSMYIGDAAGRPKDWAPKKKKDFSCSDRLFALNAGLQFYTPEEYFQKKSKVTYNMPEFDPRTLDPAAPLLNPADARLTAGHQEIIVMAGSPASGKSHFVKENLLPKGYVHVNRDIHKTWQKCVEMCKTAVEQGKSVVIDNTNPDVESRKRYLDVGKRKNVSCRCFVMTTTMAHVKHNERFREMTDKSHQSINDMILNSFKSKFSEPSTTEGFMEVVKVNIVPKFKDKEQAKLYRLFLMDK